MVRMTTTLAGTLAGLALTLAAAFAASQPAAAGQGTRPPAAVKLHSVATQFPEGRQQFAGPGAEAINGNCLTCHSPGMVLSQPAMPKAAWQAEVTKMINVYKAPVDPAAVPAIVDYLSSTKGAS